jgi:hypothetical protein
MFMNLWQLLMLYLVLGIVDGEGADGEPGGEGEGEPEPGGGEPAGEGEPESEDDDLDALINAAEPEPEPGKKAGRENAAIRDARKRAQDAEEARIRAEATLEAERRMRQGQQPSEDQRQWEAEEAKLRDPDVSDQEKWQIRSNRTIRQAAFNSNQALSTAADIRDATEFDRLATTNPKVYDRYKDRVEKMRGEWAAKGVFPPRKELLKMLLGEDILNGKVKSTAKPKAAAGAEERTTTIDRGRSPGARSDVTGKGRMSEHEKRAQRLKGVAL